MASSKKKGPVEKIGVQAEELYDGEEPPQYSG